MQDKGISLLTLIKSPFEGGRGMILIFILCLTVISSRAQLIVTKPQEISVGPCVFNANLIKANKIKRIDVVKVDKPDGEVIIDKGEAQGYDFDTLGRLSRYYYTVLNSTAYEEVDVPAIKRKGRIIRPATTRTVTKYINDTIFANVFYVTQNHIICKRVRTGDYYDAY